jgi:pimeloyl-ACP methyl ester carboxylesterase/mannose-6-phosphate isomerase-like protein (cupin superfamily)
MCQHLIAFVVRVHYHEGATEMTTVTNTKTLRVTADGIGEVPVTVTEQGEGRSFLLLHGGAGAQSMDGFAALLATQEPARVLVPTHPGFGGTPRPEGLDSIRSLARLYTRMLDDLGLTKVTVVGNSVGGWIAAEIALLGSPRVTGVVLVDAAGLELSDAPVPDFFSLTMDQVADLSYYRPDAYRLDLDHLPDQQKATMAANRAALGIYGGRAMADPSLLDRLPSVTVPVLVIWGEADRMIPVEHGRAYARTIPGARFLLLPESGHLPQFEAPDRLLAAVWDFAETAAASGRNGRPGLSVVGPADGEPTVSGPASVRIIEDGSTTSHRLGMAEIVLAPRADGPPQHRHAKHDEGFYVVSGTVRFTSGERSFDAPARTLVMVPPGAPHTFANPGGEPAVMLNTFTPDEYVQYFRDLHDLTAGGQPLSEARIADVMARYGTEPAEA